MSKLAVRALPTIGKLRLSSLQSRYDPMEHNSCITSLMIPYLPKKTETTTAFFLVTVIAILLSACTHPAQPTSSPQISIQKRTLAEESAFKAELEEMDFLALVQKQSALEAYMSIDEETKIVTFDTERARKEGHAASVIALADEMMAYQNLMMRKMKAEGISDVTQADVSIDPFPLAKMFRERARERARTHMEKARVDESSSD